MKNIEILLYKIKELCGEQGYTDGTNKFFAYELNVSEKTISRMVKLLKEAGQIITERVDNRRRITLVGENTEKCRDIQKIDIDEEIRNLQDAPEWKIATLMEFLENECKEKGVESDINSILMVRFVRVFKFKSVLKALEHYLEISTGDILEKDFKRYLDEKYINIPDVKKIREVIKSEFSMW